MYNALFACIDTKTQNVSLSGKTDFDVDEATRILRQKPTSNSFEISTVRYVNTDLSLSLRECSVNSPVA